MSSRDYKPKRNLLLREFIAIMEESIKVIAHDQPKTQENKEERALEEP